MPSVIQPMLATLVDFPFSDPAWLFENKWDGFRAICFIEGGATRFVSRRQIEMSPQYPELADVGTDVRAKTAILDGEIVALDAQGVPRFQLLQQRGGRKNRGEIERLASQGNVVYYAFDLLYLDGYDLMNLPLIERKSLLETIVLPSEVLKYSDHILEDGRELYAEVVKLGLEGIVAKRQQSAYQQKRSTDWLKIKTVQRTEAVIGGYTHPRGGRALFGALVIGLYREGHLQYIGHTGGGFNSRTLSEVFQLLQPLRTEVCPFSVKPQTNEPVEWVKPELVCEVKFSEWTADGRLRHPIFLGLRQDKRPEECTFERMLPSRAIVNGGTNTEMKQKRPHTAANSKILSPDEFLKQNLEGDVLLRTGKQTLSLTNLHKIYWPQEGITKGQLLKYYYRVSPYILPYLKNRPLILKRYPDGIEKPAFHQHSLKEPPRFVRTFQRKLETGSTVIHPVCNDVATLLYLVNLGTISQHSWASRVTSPEKPDWIIFDLDPGDAKFSDVCTAALLLKDIFDSEGLECYAKTSGSSGLHVYLPVKPHYLYPKIVEFASHVAARATAELPLILTTERSLKLRGGRIYLDYMQNGFGKSVATAYSARARPGAPVSTPLLWKEVQGRGFGPRDFTILNLFSRIESKGDLFSYTLVKRQSLARAMARVGKLDETASSAKSRAARKVQKTK